MTDKQPPLPAGWREVMVQAAMAVANMLSYQSAPRKPSIHEYGHARRALDSLRQALSSPEQSVAAVPDGWLPIETAPEGAHVLACNACGFVGRAFLHKGKWEHIGKPIHWMPLPPPPNPADKRSRLRGKP